MKNSVITMPQGAASDDRIDVFANTNLFKPEKSSHAKKVKRWKQNITGWGFSLWPLYTYVLFALVPFALSIYLSLTELNEWRITQARFIGFDNYVWLLTSAESNFFWSLFRTLYYSLSLPITIFLGLFSSILLTSRVKCKKLWRSILYIPNVCSSVGVTMMWKLIFDQQTGIINQMIVAMGGERVNFFTNFYLFMPLVIFTTTWGAGAGSILFQAALEQVNGSLVEAAKVDGASSAQVLFNITLPAISPTTFYVFITSLIGSLQAMGSIQLFANNGYGPKNEKGQPAGLTTVYYMYMMAFVEAKLHGMGKASACAWLLAIIIMVVTKVSFKLSDYWVCYDA